MICFPGQGVWTIALLLIFWMGKQAQGTAQKQHRLCWGFNPLIPACPDEVGDRGCRGGGKPRE